MVTSFVVNKLTLRREFVALKVSHALKYGVLSLSWKTYSSIRWSLFADLNFSFYSTCCHWYLRRRICVEGTSS
jgi:hypothetical protein